MITVVGESLVDVIRRPTGEVSTHPGGSPANVAVGLARLGVQVTFLTSYGDDGHGAMIARHLRGNGVAVRRASAEYGTSVAEATIDEAGAARYVFRIQWRLDPERPQPPRDSLCLHTGSIAAVLEPGATAVEALVRSARGQMTVSYDPNCRPSLMGTPATARPRIERLVRASDVVKVSDEDLGWLYQGRPYQEVARSWLGYGPALVIVTRGAHGSYAVAASGEAQRPASPVSVADTVGAGDAFTAGLLDALRQRGLLGAAVRERLRAIPRDTVD
ncbi:MAG: carbohydrate kinase family protein, partial [Micromonosporaceae bacterium]